MSDGALPARAATAPAPQAIVVALPAEMDVTNDGAVRDALTRAMRRGAAVVVADASATTYCGCAGVIALARAHHQAAATGAQLRVAASPAVRRILRLTRADQLISAYPTVAAALDGQQPAAAAAPRPLTPSAWSSRRSARRD